MDETVTKAQENANCVISSIGSDNGLAPTRRQAIIWINVGLLTH